MAELVNTTKYSLVLCDVGSLCCHRFDLIFAPFPAVRVRARARERRVVLRDNLTLLTISLCEEIRFVLKSLLIKGADVYKRQVGTLLLLHIVVYRYYRIIKTSKINQFFRN